MHKTTPRLDLCALIGTVARYLVLRTCDTDEVEVDNTTMTKKPSPPNNFQLLLKISLIMNYDR